jgi:hypothetical protein
VPRRSGILSEPTRASSSLERAERVRTVYGCSEGGPSAGFAFEVLRRAGRFPVADGPEPAAGAVGTSSAGGGGGETEAEVGGPEGGGEVEGWASGGGAGGRGPVVAGGLRGGVGTGGGAEDGGEAAAG